MKNLQRFEIGFNIVIVRNGVEAVAGLEHTPSPVDPDRSSVLRNPLWLGGLPSAMDGKSGSTVLQQEALQPSQAVQGTGHGD